MISFCMRIEQKLRARWLDQDLYHSCSTAGAQHEYWFYTSDPALQTLLKNRGFPLLWQGVRSRLAYFNLKL